MHFMFDLSLNESFDEARMTRPADAVVDEQTGRAGAIIKEMAGTAGFVNQASTGQKKAAQASTKTLRAMLTGTLPGH